MASEGREGRGRDERKETREENWRQAVPPNGASYRAAQLHCHCIALATLLEGKMRASATLYGFARAQSLAAKSPKSPGHRHAPAQKIDDG